MSTGLVGGPVQPRWAVCFSKFDPPLVHYLLARGLDQHRNIGEHVLRRLSKYLFAVALSDSVEGFRDCPFEILHFDDVPNPDGFPFLNRRQISPPNRPMICKIVKQPARRFGAS
jgi:hypothetical protein